MYVIVSVNDKSDTLKMTSENLKFDEFGGNTCRVLLSADLRDFEDPCPDKILHEEVAQLNVTRFFREVLYCYAIAFALDESV